METLPKGLLKKVIDEGYPPREAMKEAWRRVKVQQKRYATRMSYGGGYPLGYEAYKGKNPRKRKRKRKPHKIPFNQWLKAVEREFDLADIHPKWSGFTAKKLYKVYTPKKAAEKLILESKRRKKRNPIGTQSLTEWERKWGERIGTHKTGAKFIPSSVLPKQAEKELYRLSDFVVSSHIAGTIWLVPRKNSHKKARKNPIAIYNPPREQKLLYGRAYIPVIRGIKTNGRYKGEKYEHKFSKNEVSIYGNPNGSLMIKSNNNLRLWNYDKDI